VAVGYLAELCRPAANIDGRRHLRAAGRGQLEVPESDCRQTYRYDERSVMPDHPLNNNNNNNNNNRFV